MINNSDENVPFVRGLLSARNRLAAALHAAGIYDGVTIDADTVAERPVLQLWPLDGADVSRLAALVSAGSRVPPQMPDLAHRPLISELGFDEEKLGGLHGELAGALGSADVTAELGPVRTFRGNLCVDLVGMSANAATALADLIDTALQAGKGAVDALAQAFGHLAAIGLDDLPVPKWDRRLGRVTLSSPVGIRTALELGDRLGAPAMKVEDPQEPRYSEMEAIAERLQDAVRSATGGGLMDVRFEPACRGCRTSSRVQLGDIDFATAQRLARALQPGAEPS